MLLYKGKYKKFSFVLIFSHNKQKCEFFIFRHCKFLSESVLSLGLETFISRNIRHFFGVGFFCHFSSSESYFLKYSCNIKKFFFVKYKEFLKGFRFPKYNKSFLSRKCKKFLSIRARKFHFFKYKKI